jgi:hypothetical protein
VLVSRQCSRRQLAVVQQRGEHAELACGQVCFAALDA